MREVTRLAVVVAYRSPKKTDAGSEEGPAPREGTESDGSTRDAWLRRAGRAGGCAADRTAGSGSDTVQIQTELYRAREHKIQRRYNKTADFKPV